MLALILKPKEEIILHKLPFQMMECKEKEAVTQKKCQANKYSGINDIIVNYEWNKFTRFRPIAHSIFGSSDGNHCPFSTFNFCLFSLMAIININERVESYIIFK